LPPGLVGAETQVKKTAQLSPRRGRAWEVSQPSLLKSWSHVCGLQVLCFLLLICDRGLAAPTREELAVARVLYEQARIAERTERWKDCEQHVEEALDIIETPGLRFHLAYCREQQGLWVGALAAYERVAELMADGMHAPDVDRLLSSAIHALRLRLPRVKVEADELPGGCLLSIDGEQRSEVLLRNSIPLDPGEHVFEIQCKGFALFRQVIRLRPAEAPRLKVSLVPQTAQGQRPAAGSLTHRRGGGGPARAGDVTLTPKTLVLLGEALGVVAGVALGAGFELSAGAITRRMQRQSGNLTGSCFRRDPDPLCASLAASARNYEQTRLAEFVSFGGAAASALALLGSYWLLPDAPATALHVPVVKATVEATAHGAWRVGASLRGQF
jgi:hypothetical protein